MRFFEVERLIAIMKLSPYQAYVLQNYGHKYKLNSLKKKGPVLLAPYRNESARNFSDAIQRVLMGPRADLIGSDRILVQGQRGIKVYPAGYFKANMDGHRCYADQNGNVIPGR
ncbi:MAG: hypothetical protein LBG89_02395 [Rickettsiales bacterium]|jgi:hypothetical protein|nr:hypothetical protein [Rickettsiales bacterium]